MSRLKHLEWHLSARIKGDRLKPFNRNFGDWFVLHQLHKNLQRSSFLHLVNDMCSSDERDRGLRLPKDAHLELLDVQDDC